MNFYEKMGLTIFIVANASMFKNPPIEGNNWDALIMGIVGSLLFYTGEWLENRINNPKELKHE